MTVKSSAHRTDLRIESSIFGRNRLHAPLATERESVNLRRSVLNLRRRNLQSERAA